MFAKVKRAFPRDSRVGWLLRSACGRPPRWGNKAKLWDEYARTHAEVSFVQIGANDGSSGDPLAPYLDQQGWRGILVEPIPVSFAELERLRGGDSRFTLVQAAITEHAAPTVVMYAAADGPVWAHQFASLHRDVLTKHAGGISYLQDLARIEVPAKTFSELVEGIERIDVVQIDTEGHDAAIVDQIDLEHWQPTIIMFEHRHLCRADWMRCRRRLRRAGYRLAWDEMDTLASRSERKIAALRAH
jgi:FkbM family methyltransferase